MKRLITMILGMIIISTTTVSAEAPGVPQSDIVIPAITEVIPEINFTVEETINKAVEYEYANYIWNYLQDLGYNDYVCAGILGNIMVEVGGGTLALQPTIENKYHYGICQWNKKYYSDVVGSSLEAQCDFLRDNIEYEINTFGKKYDYKSFIALQDEQEAALVFAKSYERCGSGGYNKRQNCATTAYKYFTSQKEIVYQLNIGPWSVEMKSGFRNFNGD